MDAYVRDEILYREGVALGLDRDDPVIKRRVRQKLEVIAEEGKLAARAATDADLAAYLEKNAANVSRRPGMVSFEQVYFDPARHRPPGDRRRRRAAALNAAATRRGLGQPTMLPAACARTCRWTWWSRDFGASSRLSSRSCRSSTWAGPVPSAFGLHLVRVTARTAGVTCRRWTRCAQAVAREWENERRRKPHWPRTTRACASDYEVVIEGERCRQRPPDERRDPRTGAAPAAGIGWRCRPRPTSSVPPICN